MSAFSFFSAGGLIIITNQELLANAEVSKDVVEDGVTCDVGSSDFAYGRDSATQVGGQQVRGEAIRQPRTHGP